MRKSSYKRRIATITNTMYCRECYPWINTIITSKSPTSYFSYSNTMWNVKDESRCSWCIRFTVEVFALNSCAVQPQSTFLITLNLRTSSLGYLFRLCNLNTVNGVRAFRTHVTQTTLLVFFLMAYYCFLCEEIVIREEDEIWYLFHFNFSVIKSKQTGFLLFFFLFSFLQNSFRGNEKS